jgi:hypothetical protein
MASTASLSPCTTLSTPVTSTGGAPASIISSPAAPGRRIALDGFSTKVLPTAMATPNIHIGIMAGKLNGVMPATTPSGWRIE